MARHISHRTDILVLTFLQLLLQHFQLCVQHTNVTIYIMDVFLDAVDVLLPLVYLAVDDHQVLEALLHVLLIGAQCLFLFLNFLLDGGTLTLQATDRGIAIGCRTTLCTRRSGVRITLLGLFPLFGFLLCPGSGNRGLRLLLARLFLGVGREGERHRQYEQEYSFHFR